MVVLVSSGWWLPGSSCNWNLANILLLLLMVPVADATQKCHEIKELKLDAINGQNTTCSVDSKQSILGNKNHPAILDFSDARERTIKEFLARRNSVDKRAFNRIEGAIIIENNNKIVNIDFGDLKDWSPGGTPKDGIFISIQNNPYLKNIYVNPSLTLHGKSDSRHQVVIYNNPSLSTATLRNILNQSKRLGIYTRMDIQKNFGECHFYNPYTRNYTAPTDYHLNQCTQIIGDLILVQRTIRYNLKLHSGGCIVLTDVDLRSTLYYDLERTKFKIKCENGRYSEFYRVKGLCGADLVNIKMRFPSNPIVIAHDSCILDVCTTAQEVEQQYGGCRSIVGDVFHLEKWCIPGSYMDNYPNYLKNATATLNFVNTGCSTIRFPQLETVKNLRITDNRYLYEINIPALTSIEELTIAHNPSLEYSFFPTLKHLRPKRSYVECSPDKTIRDITDLSICTHIRGDLILEGLQDMESNPLAGKFIVGCVTIANSSLTNLDFLKETYIQCNGHILLKNNPYLCKYRRIGDIPVIVEGTFRTKYCACVYLREGDCETFEGDLIINDNTRDEDLRELQEINGRLIINGTTRKYVDLPMLRNITSPKAPVLVIMDNKEMLSLIAPKLKTIETSGTGKPLIRIINNNQMSELRFLSREFQSKCVDQDETTVCEFKKNDAKYDNGGGHALLIILAISLPFALCGLAIIGFWIYLDISDIGRVVHTDDHDGEQMMKEDKKEKKLLAKKSSTNLTKSPSTIQISSDTPSIAIRPSIDTMPSAVTMPSAARMSSSNVSMMAMPSTRTAIGQVMAGPPTGEYQEKGYAINGQTFG